MTVHEAILARRSIRAFRPDPVDRAVLAAILRDALHTPSWANSQPWEIYAASGETLSRIRKEYAERYAYQAAGGPDLPRPKEWPVACIERRKALAPDMKRDCGNAAREFGALNQNLFGAPAVLFLCMDKTLTQWSVFDIGAFSQSVMLLAAERGLGTIPAITLVHYPEVLRYHLGIPDSQNVVIGIAIGYTDEQHDINEFRSARKSLDDAVKWSGF